MSGVWFYGAMRPILSPTSTPPLDLFTLYLVLLSTEFLQIGGYLFDHSVFDIPLPSGPETTAHILSSLALIALIAVVLTMTFAIPSARVDQNEIVSIQPSSLTMTNN